MSKDYTSMEPQELQAELKRLKDELEDMEDTFNFNLTNTSAHLRSGIVAEHEDELLELKAEIEKVQGILSA